MKTTVIGITIFVNKDGAYGFYENGELCFEIAEAHDRRNRVICRVCEECAEKYNEYLYDDTLNKIINIGRETWTRTTNNRIKICCVANYTISQQIGATDRN